MTVQERKQAAQNREWSRDYLHKILPPGSIVWHQNLHLTNGGRYTVQLLAIEPAGFQGNREAEVKDISNHAARVLELRKDPNRPGLLTYEGGPETVYELARQLWPNEYRNAGHACDVLIARRV